MNCLNCSQGTGVAKLRKKCVYKDLTQIKVPRSHLTQKHSQSRKDGKSLIRDQLTSGPPISSNPQRLTQSFFHISTMEQIPGLKAGWRHYPAAQENGSAVTKAFNPAQQRHSPVHVILTIPTTFLTAFRQQITKKEKRGEKKERTQVILCYKMPVIGSPAVQGHIHMQNSILTGKMLCSEKEGSNGNDLCYESVAQQCGNRQLESGSAQLITINSDT